MCPSPPPPLSVACSRFIPDARDKNVVRASVGHSPVRGAAGTAGGHTRSVAVARARGDTPFRSQSVGAAACWISLLLSSRNDKCPIAPPHGPVRGGHPLVGFAFKGMPAETRLPVPAGRTGSVVVAGDFRGTHRVRGAEGTHHFGHDPMRGGGDTPQWWAGGGGDTPQWWAVVRTYHDSHCPRREPASMGWAVVFPRRPLPH
jgi:hypothetical protein